ncbi:hypothetical protein FS837_007459 [Tulasnella sp. UAMH 9824]|nr:hypothetical protein FS837_007459 [Tulasnella sp. UAMH 9824]
MILPSERDAKSEHTDTVSDSGITSFTASTDPPLKVDTPAQEPVARYVPDSSNPPPYSIAGPSSPPLGAQPSARVNHLFIHKLNDAVRGYYTVDVDLVVSPQLFRNVVPGETADNLKLSSNNGAVAADVVLIGRGDKRASLVAETKNGGITFKLLSRRNCPFRLTAKSWNGRVSVYLPRDFIGTLTSSTDNGGLDLSEGIKRNYNIFYEDRKAAKGFIGDWSSSGYGHAVQSGAAWTGDELVVSSKNGRVKVSYVDEFNSSSGGFFSSLFRGST